MPPRTVAAPAQNTVYVAMLGLAVFAMTVGCLMLGLELAGYDTATPPPVTAFTPPKVEPRPTAPATATPAGTPAPGGSAKAPPTPTPPPAAPVFVPTLPTPPAVAKVEPPKVAPPKVEDANRGPRPGFNLTAPKP